MNFLKCLSEAGERKFVFPNEHVAFDRLCVERMSFLWGKDDGRKSVELLGEGRECWRLDFSEYLVVHTCWLKVSVVCVQFTINSIIIKNGIAHHPREGKGRMYAPPSLVTEFIHECRAYLCAVRKP